MKKLIPIVVFLAIVGFISQAEAQDTCGMSVTVLVSASVSVTDEPLAFGDVNAGASDVSDSGCTVTNDGSTQNDYLLQITASPSGWSVEETVGSVDWNEFRLLALFTSNTSLITGDFSTDNDIVNSSVQTTASSTIYAITAEGASVKGYDCTENAVRKLWFRFDAPSGTDLTSQQWITVTVTAVQG
ncbi:hypothetical protein ES705_50334 [subsurface metagenome]